MRSLAQVLSAVFQPVAGITWFFLILFALHGGWRPALLTAWFFLAVLPTAFLVWGLRRGWWSDLDVSQVTQRRFFLPVTAAFVGAAALVASARHYPVPLTRGLVGIFAWIAVSTVISWWWKISLHAGGVAGLVALAYYLLGARAALAASWLPLAVSWARVHLGRHTLAQVIAGMCLGAGAVVWAFRL